MNGNRKLFWNEVSKANRGKVDNSSRIKDGNRRLGPQGVEMQKISWIIFRVSII